MNDNESAPGIDARTFWRVLGQRAMGMTIVTARDEVGPAGLVALSAAHVSADPATMLVSIDRKTAALATVLVARHFAVNFLPASDAALVDIFGGRAGVTGAARFEGRDWGTLVSGAPVLATALGAFDCAVDQVIEQGEVTIVIGRVLAATAGDGEPLVFYRGKSFRGVGEPI